MCVASSGNVYIATASRVLQFADGRFEPLTGVTREGDSPIEQLVCAREGSLWVGFANSVIRQWKNGHLTTYAPKPTAAPQVTLLYEDPTGGIWAAYGERLHQLRNGAFETVLLEDGKTNLGTVYSMTVDNEGGIWAGLQTGGMVRMRVNRISTLASSEGLPNDSARSVYQDHQGAIWIGTASGFGKYLDGRVVPYTEVSGRRLGAVRSFAEDAQSRLWVAAGKDLLLMQKGQLSAFPGWDGHSEIEVIYRDARNCMWIGTDGDGVYQFENDKSAGGYGGFRNLREKDGLPGNRIRAISEDRNGAMWISVFGIGVARYAAGVFTSYTAASGELAGNRVTAIHADEDGAIWFATRGGLTRLKDGKFFSYTSASGMLANFVYSIVDDGKGNFWFSCAQGLFKVPKNELRDYADGRIRKMTSVSYGVRDGMKTRAFNVGNQPEAWKTMDGILLFSSMKGVVMVDPGHLAPGNYVPPVYVESVSINRQTVPLNSEPRLPLGTGEAEIDYTALSYTDPEKLRFRYMLEGVDTDWVDAGSRRFAYYANLPAGNFRFHVIAGNVDGPWNQQGAAFAFYLTPHIYQTRLFWAAVASGVLLLGWAFYRLHMLEVKARYSAVLAERNRISQDIHDTFAQNLAGIALQLDSMTMQLEEIPEGLRESIDAACNLTRYSLAEARRTVTDLRSDDLERADLPVALPEIATRLVGTAAVETSIQVTGTPHRLNAVTEKNLLRIFQEAMANALKHSQAETILIELKYGPEGLSLRVKDNGRGFDAERTISLGIGHYGLTGMRERAERIGGCLTLKSAPGEGTELLVVVPFQA
jgi:signal transduction histidine kinase/streptogramin lyase